jgi:hypothetical protein
VYLLPCSWARLLSQVRWQKGFNVIKLLGTGSWWQRNSVCVFQDCISGCDHVESDRHLPMCQEDLLPPPLLYTSTSFYSEYLIL